MRFLGLFVCAASLAAQYAVAAPDCTLKKVASFDVSVDSGSLLTSAQIEGKDLKVMLDTGSPFNLVDQELADELKLSRQSMMGYQVTDAAGKLTAHMASAHSVSIGDWKATNVPFLVSGENRSAHSNVQAVFGNPFLEANDLELDLAHGKVNLFLRDHCPGQVVYWTHEYVQIPIRLQQSGHIALPVTLDGRQTFAMLDTGASRSLVSKRMAETDFNIMPGGDSDKPDGFMVAGTGAHLPFYKHVFGKFDIGGIEFHNTQLLISPDRLDLITKSENNNPHIAIQDDKPVETPIILGLPHITKLRLFFAFGEHMVYVTPADAH